MNERLEVSLRPDCICKLYFSTRIVFSQHLISLFLTVTQHGFSQYLENFKKQKSYVSNSPTNKPTDLHMVASTNKTIKDLKGLNLSQEPSQSVHSFNSNPFEGESLVSKNRFFNDIYKEPSMMGYIDGASNENRHDPFGLLNIERLAWTPPPHFSSYYEPPKPDTPPSKVIIESA